jgi:hypothetical protein
MITLTARLLAEPLTNYLKRMHLENKWKHMNGFFVMFGGWWQMIEYHVNRTLMRNAAYTLPKRLKPEALIEKGIQAFYELLFYSILIALPLR